MTKRLFLSGLIALASTLTGCARVPGPVAPEPYTPDPAELEAIQEQLTEEDVRAFLAAKAEARLAEEEADATVAEGREPEETEVALFDQADFDLPITMNDRVEFWMEYFQDRARDRFATYLTRMGRYEDLIRGELRARGMPEDLIYLALIESGFLPSATSRAAAVGIWQFITPTARRYKLEVSRYVDERRDPIKATTAALDYLQDLYDRFGSWYLAAAGYNSGENRVERILRERAGGARGADSLFWEISAYLPSETRNYVPKMIAAAILGKYRDRYEFNDIVPDVDTPFDVVTVPDATELGVIARAAGVEKEVVEILNPHYLRGVTPPGRKVEVRIPAGRAETFQVAYAKIPPRERVTRIEHVVRSGETLSHIARRYGVSVAAIQETNGIRNPNSIRAGRTLVIAYGNAAGARNTASSTASATRASTNTATVAAASDTKSSGEVTYRVRAGDSLWTIARQHGVTVADLRKWNGLDTSNRILPGQQLRISSAEEVIVYRIQPGDTIWDIARKHGVTVDQILSWNSIDAGATIRPGEELRVPVIR